MADFGPEWPADFIGIRSLSAALALIQGLELENDAQAALPVNAACRHAASAKVMTRLSSLDGERRVVMLATAVARLSRATAHWRPTTGSSGATHR